ncbi:hypothetical protein VD0002_g8906 [Verticillium dahliae]|uniref:HAUS augmin-like complex subunit 6 N-terminal domain-containing protein n=3 Tax=Verticillium TaxID=1036719 RepID=G2WQY1_VERDV|nr:uncharacterized protein VDAG_00762 [Verticillium dahliae VdLs.17]KAH6706684.1 HAUS augmin-like complex subunit 6 N-terminus-domain-containing protein [Verticillium dahliae]EGY14080.1 hypothetical protein VDAG_00762 [Verticillium dahliae VdLs.17]PNH33234.1 hypothetical protein BJF96_g3579 [Verticillium dahliae]PNH54435.1 hypothetical protein VD0003_g3066 [Verticillium dahliae]PNH58630.1 hypothetical protein VD0002_g8906 [Verticillium dahliae]
MASAPPNSLLARSRSLRSASNRNPPVAAATATATATPQAAATPTITPNLSIFLTNLRLLDFDSYPDWPAFDAQTFAIQKRRIQSVEWALFQLFALWDPEETRVKLEPYFPPRDHVQSINLRSALQRCLEQAKKNGALGRDAVVRKTMLDDCKGDRLEEVLAVFSSAVLKKMAAAASEAEGEHPTIAEQLALENRGYGGERDELVALALAHRVSLTHVLRRKNEARRRYKDLSELLDIKERSIARRQAEAEAEACRANGPGEAVSADAVLDMRRMLRNNWTGSERWMETLLQGDASARHDGVLSAPFDRVWRRVEAGRLSELEDHGKGLLEQLEGRVKAQRESLQKWQNFQQKMFGRQPDVKPLAEAEKRKERGINLGFGAHETLHLGQFPVTEKLSLQAPELDPVHASILDDCKKDLAQIGVVRRTDIRSLLGPRLREPTRPDRLSVGTDGGTEEGVSEISELEEEEEEEEEPILEAALPPKPAHRRNNSQSSAPSSSQRSEPPADPPQELSRRSSNRRPVIHRNTSSITKDRPVVNLSRFSSQGSHASGSKTSDRPRSRSPEKPTRPSIIIEPEQTPSPEPPSPTQNMADQILHSMAAASPSPVKQNKPRHTLSLAERTRMSMARMSFGGKAFTPEDEDELDFRTLPIRPAPMATPTEEEDEATFDLGDSALDDLASRTRKSMAGFEAARKKAQLDRRRSQRQSRLPPPPRQEGSLFPKVEEETTQLDVDASVLADELIQGEDMEAVFKSRPRLQTSPAASPRRPIESDEYL